MTIGVLVALASTVTLASYVAVWQNNGTETSFLVNPFVILIAGTIVGSIGGLLFGAVVGAVVGPFAVMGRGRSASATFAALSVLGFGSLAWISGWMDDVVQPGHRLLIVLLLAAIAAAIGFVVGRTFEEQAET